MKYTTGASKKNRPAKHDALRIGIVQNGHLIEERKLQDCAKVTVGQSPRNLFTVSARGLPRTYQLFRQERGRQVLRFAPASDGRVTIDGTLRTLQQACDSGAAQRVGDWYELPLQPGARGKLSLGDVTVLFQQIYLPPTIPQPRLPASLQGGIANRMDPVFSMVLSGTLAAAAAFLIAVQLVPKPTGVVRSARISALLGNRSRVQHHKPAVPKPGAATRSQKPGDQVSDSTATPTQTNATPKPVSHRGDRPAKPHIKLQRGTPEYRAALASLTDMQPDQGRFTKIILHGQCNDPKGCKNSVTGRDHLRNGGSFGDLDDQARRPGGVSSGRPTGPSSNTRRPGLAYIGGKPVVSATRTNPVSTKPKPMHQPVVIKAPRGTTGFKAPKVRAKGGASISAKVRRRVYGLRYCYNRLLPSQPTLKGAAKISFMVLPNGRVRNVIISTGMGSAMKSCVSGKVARWHLGKPKIYSPVFYGPFYVRFYPRN